MLLAPTCLHSRHAAELALLFHAHAHTHSQTLSLHLSLSLSLSCFVVCCDNTNLLCRWFAFNLLAELDAPGEFFVDTDSGMLHFIPPDNGKLPAGSEVAVSVGGNAVVMNGVSNVHMKGISFQYGRSVGIAASDATNVTISNATVSCFGGRVFVCVCVCASAKQK